MKRRIIFAILLFLILAVLCLPAAWNLHLTLSRQTEALTVNPVTALRGIAGNARVLRIYLLLCALCALFCFWAVAGSSYVGYKSRMRRLTPDIETPEAAGQGQFGTARWLDRRKYGQVFDEMPVPDNAAIAELLEAGRRDKEEIDHNG